MRRTQIYLDEAQARELARRSDARGVTASHMIREAIADYLSDGDDEATELTRQRAALTDAAGTIPRLPDGTTYVEQVRQADYDRDDELEEQWRSR